MSQNKFHGLWLDIFWQGDVDPLIEMDFLEHLFLCQDSLSIKTYTHTHTTHTIEFPYAFFYSFGLFWICPLLMHFQ